VRACARKKGFEGCWECEGFEEREKMDFLKGVHGNATVVNLRAIRKNGTEKFLNGKKLWYSD
jgi:hypothetical protein